MARQSLQRPMVSYPPPPPPPESSPPKRPAFSEEVRDYVRRAFDEDNKVPGITVPELQDKVKAIIGSIGSDLSVVDWTTYPLPQHIILREREQAAALSRQNAPLTNPSYPPSTPFHKDIMREPYNPHSANGKRKSSDVDEFGRQLRPDASPPWKKNKSKPSQDNKSASNKKTKQLKKAETQRMNHRADEGLMGAAEKRRARFGIASSPPPFTNRSESPPADLGPFIGTSQTVEKKYFRLTAAAKREDVRPLPVLQEALAMVISNWKAKEDYEFAWDQLKSIRQDLTVQRIKNEFTVRVYECHARIALQMKDMGEYNQCQTQLRELYKQKLGGNPGEFLAYRILYIIYTCNQTDMNDLLADLTPEDKEEESVKYALQVRKALASGNYHKFFRLYNIKTKTKKDMSQYMLNMFVDRERLKALAVITKA